MTRFGIEELQERVKSAVDAEGMRPFARRAGVGIGVVRSMLDGRDPSFSNARVLSAAFGHYLNFGSVGASEAAPDAPVSEFAHIPVHLASLAAGGGSHNDTEELVGHLAFRRSWLRRMRIEASSAVLARASGESMAPTIHDGDMLLIDRSKGDPPQTTRSPKDTRPGSIYAILDEGAARVKRIELAPGGSLLLLSDNPAFAPEFRPASAVSIIGKVMWWGHTERE